MSKLNLVFSIIIVVFIISLNASVEREYCEISENSGKINDNCGVNKYLTSNKRYILYDINPPEGFNLRRDVYIRVAVLMRHLVESDVNHDWTLILPPWSHLMHWKSHDIDKQSQIPWGTFFDIDSLNKFVSVMEMYDFLREYKSKNEITTLDQVYILQNDAKMFETGDFRDKNEIADCSNTEIRYKRSKSNNQFDGYFWGYKNISAKNVKCITYHGTALKLIQNLRPQQYRSYMFDHMEIALHDYYGSVDFWRARRSMRYNSQLYNIANEFRRKYLNSTNEADNIHQPNDWRDEKDTRTAIGGPYLAVHLRRRDFVISHVKTVPTIANAAYQLNNKMKELSLDTIFVATDTNDDEYGELQRYLSDYTVYRYKPSNDVKKKFKDGGVAIIDQIICSTARYFIGTQESTFTFRIQESREIFGFPSTTTFNNLCVKINKCTPGSQWTIVW